MDAMTGSRYVASSTNTGNHHIRILGRDAIPGRGSTRAPPKSDWVKLTLVDSTPTAFCPKALEICKISTKIKSMYRYAISYDLFWTTEWAEQFSVPRSPWVLDGPDPSGALKVFPTRDTSARASVVPHGGGG